jgi:hypothetical protein
MKTPTKGNVRIDLSFEGTCRNLCRPYSNLAGMYALDVLSKHVF